MSDPYASHISFLTIRGQSAGNRIRRILELGSGIYSTPLFLDKTVFAYVERVVSIESIQVWADKVKVACGDDPRLELLVKPEPIEDYLDTIELDFDWIFVDNSECWENRVKTIEYLGNRVTTQDVIIHDFEHKFYQDAAHAFPNKIVATIRTPHTALVWK